MVELFERRVTRSLSSELQNRTHQAQQIPQAPGSNGHLVNSNRANSNGIPNNRVESDGFTFESLPYFRTTSEEILIRTFVDGAIMQSTPSMDALGLCSLPLASRRNSEELFSTWLANQDGSGLTSSPHWARQPSGRIPNDSSMPVNQQDSGNEQQLINYQEHGQQPNFVVPSKTLGDHLKPITEGEEREAAVSELSSLQSLPWFQQNQPMTRSRSAELRRMYAAMQGIPSLPSAGTLQKLATEGTHGLNQAVASLGAFARGLANGRVAQNSHVTHPSPSSNAVPNVGSGNSISNMVHMLKGSLERKRLVGNKQQNQHSLVELSTSCGTVPGHMDAHVFPAEAETQNGTQINLGGISPSLCAAPTAGAVSPSESSGGAPTLSAGVSISNGPSNSGTVLTHQNSMKWTAQSLGAVDQPFKKLNHGGNIPSPRSQRSGDGPVQGFPNSSISKKPEQLTRAGSLNSSGRSGLGLDNTNPTKMRRVERREKMLEAKGRPVLPSDLQVALKRCDALEKEVRSLKLTVSFMNRKDSEQTKKIEELEKENQELQQEKQRLLEEVERLASVHDY